MRQLRIYEVPAGRTLQDVMLAIGDPHPDECNVISLFDLGAGHTLYKVQHDQFDPVPKGKRIPILWQQSDGVEA